MIVSEQRYEATKRRMADFEEALAHAEDHSAERDPLLQSVLRKNIEDELQAMYEQLAEYETRLHPKSPVSVLIDGADLPTVLIRSRIAAGFRQADLAERLGITEQQVRKYAATRYADITSDQVQAVASALGVTPSIGLLMSDQGPERGRHARKAKR